MLSGRALGALVWTKPNGAFRRMCGEVPKVVVSFFFASNLCCLFVHVFLTVSVRSAMGSRGVLARRPLPKIAAILHHASYL